MINEECLICKKKENLGVHHLTPRSIHISDASNRRLCILCWDCHHYLHRRFTNDTLANDYDTPEKILAIDFNIPVFGVKIGNPEKHTIMNKRKIIKVSRPIKGYSKNRCIPVMEGNRIRYVYY